MKELIIWNDAYSVDLPEIDSQHKKLIGLINQLYNLYLERNQHQVHDVIKEIQDYTVYHFSTEENLFKAKNYSQQEEHKVLHEQFIDEFNQLLEQYKGAESVLTMKIMTFLQRWLTNHILKEDKKYVGYLN